MIEPLTMAKLIREGMDNYWRVVYSATDDGLDAIELSWKRDWERDMQRAYDKYGKQFEEVFGK